MQQAHVVKTNSKWSVSGLIGMRQKQFDSVVKQLLMDSQLQGDIKIMLLTKAGYQTYSPTDLSNSSVRALIANKL